MQTKTIVHVEKEKPILPVVTERVHPPKNLILYAYAKNLPNKGLGTIDPYCQISSDEASISILKSKTEEKSNNTDPIWLEDMELTYRDNRLHDKLKLAIKVGASKYTKVSLEKRDQFQKMAFYVLIRTSLYLNICPSILKNKKVLAILKF